MKLIEIKNNFAKVYYRPSEDELLLSGFLTVNDGNRIVIAQIISSESTTKPDVNCAVLKFSFSLTEDGSFRPYDGYVPSPDAKIAITNPKLIERAFSSPKNSFRAGELNAQEGSGLMLGKRFFENFVYIQSDRNSDTEYIFNLLSDAVQPSITIDTDGTIDIEDAQTFVLTKNFKLPVNFHTLNYIYENDLNGLTVEQKAIVQDIVIEIQDYIKSEKTGFIPFSTLLSVVDDIYKTDKSVGIILFRNKLIKYQQEQLFGSSSEEFTNIFNALKKGGKVLLKLHKTSQNWKKEALNFVINNIKAHLFVNIDDELFSKELIAKIYEKKEIRPIIASAYTSVFANQLKSYAKNIVLFAPEQVQKTYPTYASFLSKLNSEQYIISGQSTLYAPIILTPPIIVEEEEKVIVEDETIPAVPQIIEEEPEIEVIDAEEEEETETEENVEEPDDEEMEDSDEEQAPQEVVVQKSAIRNIFEEAVEAEIAKDVDSMFYANTEESDDETESEDEEADTDTEEDEESPYKEMFSDEDLDMLDGLNEDEEQEEEETQEETFLEDDGSEISGLEDITEENLLEPEPPAKSDSGLAVKKAPVPNIPVYTTPYDDNLRPEETIKVAEGNIVYHAKYGRGVVEQIISYGKKTLCSIQFDNVGRRLLDPNLADLKQA